MAAQSRNETGEKEGSSCTTDSDYLLSIYWWRRMTIGWPHLSLWYRLCSVSHSCVAVQWCMKLMPSRMNSFFTCTFNGACLENRGTWNWTTISPHTIKLKAFQSTQWSFMKTKGKTEWHLNMHASILLKSCITPLKERMQADFFQAWWEAARGVWSPSFHVVRSHWYILNGRHRPRLDAAN